jgi:hypothetical protein
MSEILVIKFEGKKCIGSLGATKGIILKSRTAVTSGSVKGVKYLPAERLSLFKKEILSS